MIELTVTKTSENPSVFTLSPSSIEIGGKDSNLIDYIHVNIPEEWQGKVIRVTFNQSTLYGGNTIPKILNADGIIELKNDVTLCSGDLVIDATGVDGSVSPSTGCKYTVYNHPKFGGTEQDVTPSEYQQFVAETKGYSDSAQANATAADESKKAAALSEQNAKNSETAAQTAQEVAENAKLAAQGSAGAAAQSEANSKNYATVLDEKSSEINQIKLPYGQKNAPLVVFTDDDMHYDFSTYLKPIYDSKGIKCTLACNPYYVGDGAHYTYAELKALQNEGYEIVSHGYNHVDFDTMTDDQLILDCENVKKSFSDNGIDYKNIVIFPDNKTGNMDIIKKYYQTGIGNLSAGNVANSIPISSMFISRIDLEGYTLSQLKSQIDRAISLNQIVVYMSHSWMDSFHEPQKLQDISDLIDYIKSKNVEIVTASKMIEKVGNVIEIGQSTDSNYFILSRLGYFLTNSGGFKFEHGISINNPPSYFDVDKVTVSRHINGSVGVPNNVYGYVFTFKISTDSSEAYTIQILFTAGITNEIYKRRAIDSSNWSDWLLLNPDTSTLLISLYGGSSTTLDQSITNYTVNKITVTRYFNDQTLNSPTPNMAGILTTYRFSNDAYSYQSWKSINSTGIWRRNWSGSAWGTWGQ